MNVEMKNSVKEMEHIVEEISQKVNQNKEISRLRKLEDLFSGLTYIIIGVPEKCIKITVERRLSKR